MHFSVLVEVQRGVSVVYNLSNLHLISITLELRTAQLPLGVICRWSASTLIALTYTEVGHTFRHSVISLFVNNASSFDGTFFWKCHQIPQRNFGSVCAPNMHKKQMLHWGLYRVVFTALLAPSSGESSLSQPNPLFSVCRVAYILLNFLSVHLFFLPCLLVCFCLFFFPSMMLNVVLSNNTKY